MSDLILNLDVSASQPQWKTSHPNQKHRRFLKQRKFLERKGFLKQKQLPHQSHQYRPFKPENTYANHHRSFTTWERNNSTPNLESSVHSLDKSSLGKDANSFGSKETSLHVQQPKSFPTSNSRHSLEGPRHPCDSRLTWPAPGGTKMRQGSAKPSLSYDNHSSSRDHSHPFTNTHKVSPLSEYQSGLFAACPYKMVAIDCEMVGTGPGARHSELARCSIVSHEGDVVYDKYVKPPNPITDYRTRWSGIRKHHMKNAMPFKVAQKEILKILAGKVVIGHAIHNDFKALCYVHPKSLTRDTSQMPLLNRKAGFPEKEVVSLKRLTKQLLNREIQVGKKGHSSVEDARATMELYRLIEAEWERELALAPVKD
ncbi:interferon-stimulated 20 kDa exonuclease-like 2 [Rhinatrema bivittatum]|uniref:interferon-stimulated 20 kDa exonuclease-like 2 n=1 Tax=Rhinatrema bivittatum TaxID=194408 RepID=UPI0011299D6E|nr:interferon-stimulated 20 kDa exonuclease-like 2 [Rhinatrema bivittatum]XP_029437560.1 interferon-stimulated 20 kDa exonuclease-like 2 [Rhinatrema bivittatum]